MLGCKTIFELIHEDLLKCLAHYSDPFSLMMLIDLIILKVQYMHDRVQDSILGWTFGRIELLWWLYLLYAIVEQGFDEFPTHLIEVILIPINSRLFVCSSMIFFLFSHLYFPLRRVECNILVGILLLLRRGSSSKLWSRCTPLFAIRFLRYISSSFALSN